MGCGHRASVSAEDDLVANLRFLTGLVAPGGVLLLAAWALDHEPVVREVAAPYALYFCFGTLAAAVLLSWYHDQSALLGVALAVALAILAKERWPDDINSARLAATFLLPWNFVLFASLRERGVVSFDGVFKIGMVGAQAAAVVWIAGHNTHLVGYFLYWGGQSGGSSPLPLTAQLSYAFAALTLLALVFLRRTKVEQGLLWTLAAIFLGVHGSAQADTLLFYAGTAGLVLVFAVLEHGYDIAYRDELTGLLGRRAFTSLMERLGRTYTFAICDVDHFKQFNDKYGHDVGDDVLKMVAAKLSHVEGGGRVFRYGGEEFLVVFRGRSASDAQPFMESVRNAIADTGFVLRGADRPARKPMGFRRTDHEKQQAVTVTISIGIAEKSTRHSTPELVLDAADAALYAAKAAGRNCVRLDDTIPA
jgi:diguanylate cyclase (GGDEF)-like protein